jgi:hypothetical protein
LWSVKGLTVVTVVAFVAFVAFVALAFGVWRVALGRQPTLRCAVETGTTAAMCGAFIGSVTVNVVP